MPKCTSVETTSTESQTKNISKNHNYNYNHIFTLSNHFDHSSDDTRHYSFDNIRQNSEEKNLSFHKYQREQEHHTSTPKINSTKIAHCCNFCRNFYVTQITICLKNAYTGG